MAIVYLRWPAELDRLEREQWDAAAEGDFEDWDERRATLSTMAERPSRRWLPVIALLSLAAWIAALGIAYGLWRAADWMIEAVVRWVG